jgi:divalent metal cation (Fe/Co/Zn/Cd) transporter
LNRVGHGLMRYWLDPAVALLIAVIVAYHASALIRKVVTAIKAVKRSTPAAE